MITPNLIAKGRFFCNQKHLYLPIWDCVVPHIYYIFASGSKNASPGENCGKHIGEQFGGQRGWIKPWALAGV